MIRYPHFSRRKFLNIFKFLFIFLLASCTRESKNIVIGLQKSFLPKSFKNLLPNIWKIENNHSDANMLAVQRCNGGS